MAAVTTDRAELSSIASSLEQLTKRVAAMAETAQQDKAEQVAVDLFAVERELASAERRLSKMVSRLP